MSVFSYSFISDFMKNWLLYYYKLNIVDIFPQKSDFLVFAKNNENYLLKKYDENSFDIKNISEVIKSYNLSHSNYYLIVDNIMGQMISKIDDSNYVLLRINGLIDTNIDLKEIVYNLQACQINGSDFKLDWRDLWQKRLDYIEYQIGQLGKNKEEVLNSFSFFSGMGENAIGFISANNIDYKNCRKSLCHERILYPNRAIDYYDILHLKTDYEIRDVAEYIKSKFLVCDNLDGDLDFIINKYGFSNDELKLFYARLLFPSNYFDLIEEIIVSNAKECKIEIYVEKVGLYIDLLKDVYVLMQKKMELLIPSWLKIEN